MVFVKYDKTTLDDWQCTLYSVILNVSCRVTDQIHYRVQLVHRSIYSCRFYQIFHYIYTMYIYVYTLCTAVHGQYIYITVIIQI